MNFESFKLFFEMFYFINEIIYCFYYSFVKGIL